MLRFRAFIARILVVGILCMVGLWVHKENVFPYKIKQMIDWSKKVAEKATELEQCEKKLLLNTVEKKVHQENVVFPYKNETTDWSKKVEEKAKELEQCEKKLLLNTVEQNLSKTDPEFPATQEQLMICSKKVSEKSIELAQCQRKLLGRSVNTRSMGLNALTPWLAPIVWDGTYDMSILDKQHSGTRIGLFVFAVKKYIRFLQPFLETAERYFMVGHKVTYYVFTDKVDGVVKPKMADGRILQLHNVVADQRWQDVSMRRMEILTVFTKKHMPNEIDYLVCADVDMVFKDRVGVEILGDLVATIHPAFLISELKHFTYERRPISAAYIPDGEGDFYYMAAFYGGKVDEIYKLSVACQNGIIEDKKKNIEAVWQEESHLNRYLVYYKPTKVLSSEYIWNTNAPYGDLVKKKRFIILNKNNQEIRN